jgi:hypothetical protein
MLAEADLAGTWYSFEKVARKPGGGEGWADVWKRHCFAWDYKRKHADLNAALRQLQQYALALENSLLLIVSDLDTILIHTNFTNTFTKSTLCRWLPDKVTDEATEAFASLAQRLRERRHDPQHVISWVVLWIAPSAHFPCLCKSDSMDASNCSVSSISAAARSP